MEKPLGVLKRLSADEPDDVLQIPETGHHGGLPRLALLANVATCLVLCNAVTASWTSAIALGEGIWGQFGLDKRGEKTERTRHSRKEQARRGMREKQKGQGTSRGLVEWAQDDRVWGNGACGGVGSTGYGQDKTRGYE
jgi:hypothetical protein